MGQETHCIATWNGKRSVGRARLETDELLFRGEFRLTLPFKSILELGVADGRLSVRVPEGTATFNLGPRAQQWAEERRCAEQRRSVLRQDREWVRCCSFTSAAE